MLAVALVSVFGLGALVAWAIARSGGAESSPPVDARSLAAAVDSGAVATADAAVLAPTPAPELTSDAATPPLDGGPATDAAADQLTGAQRRAKALVAQARATQNPLRRLTLADKAFRLDPKNRDARYLFGEALVKSGDLDNRARGCRLLRRSARRFRRAGCAD